MRTWDPSPWMHTGADWYLHGRARGWLCLIMVYSITALVLSGCGWRNLVGIWQPSPNHGIKFKIWRLNISSLNLTKRINAVHSKQIQHGLELVSHLQKITENIRVLSKQISSQKNRCPPCKMFMLLNKQQKHILAINIFYFEILLQYSISCRSWNSAVFHPSSSVVWTSSSQDVTLNAPESLASEGRSTTLHEMGRGERLCPWDGEAQILLCLVGVRRGNSEFTIWLKRFWLFSKISEKGDIAHSFLQGHTHTFSGLRPCA